MGIKWILTLDIVSRPQFNLRRIEQVEMRSKDKKEKWKMGEEKMD